MKIVPFGVWSQREAFAARDALLAHERKMQDHPFVEQNSTDVVWERLVSGQLRAALLGSYLLVYDVGPAWCSRADLLYEFVLVRTRLALETHPTFYEAIEGMRYIARANHCTGIITGNGVLRSGLAKLYERAGAKRHSESYHLEV